MSSPPDEKPWRRPRKLNGLGDLVALVAEPIAKASDLIFGTHIQGCKGCKERQADLNQKFPFVP